MGKLNQKERVQLWARGHVPTKDTDWSSWYTLPLDLTLPVECALGPGRRSQNCKQQCPQHHGTTRPLRQWRCESCLMNCAVTAQLRKTRDADFYCPQGRKRRAAGPGSMLSPAISSLPGTECLSLKRKEDAGSHLTGWRGG